MSKEGGGAGRRGLEEKEARVRSKALELYPTHSGETRWIDFI